MMKSASGSRNAWFSHLFRCTHTLNVGYAIHRVFDDTSLYVCVSILQRRPCAGFGTCQPRRETYYRRLIYLEVCDEVAPIQGVANRATPKCTSL